MSDAGLEQKRKFFLVDDHVMLRFGMVNFIKSNGWDCAGEAGSAAETVQKMEALDLLGGGSLPEVLITDINLGQDDGCDLIKTCKSRWPAVKYVCYSMFNDAAVVSKAFDSGATGYVSKSAPEDEIIACLEDVMAGRKHIELSMIPQVMVYDNLMKSLTKRESEIATLLALGKDKRQISGELNVSVHSIENRLSCIYEKLGVNNISALLKLMKNER